MSGEHYRPSMKYRPRSLSRRAAVSGLALGLAATSASARPDYPTRTITGLLGWAPGTSNDTVGRLVAEVMSRDLEVPVIIDNKPGAASSVATGLALRAPADGYTVLFGASAMLINHILNPDQPPLRPHTELIPVGTMVDLPFLVHVNADLPVKSLRELVEYARTHPGHVACGCSVTGSITHLALELIKDECGIEIVHIPYNSPPAILPDLFAGRLQMAITAPIRQTQSRMLAVTSSGRFGGLPELPSVREALELGTYDAVAWQGLFVRNGTSTEIVRRLRTALAKATADPTVVARSIPVGGIITPGDGEALARLVERDLQRWQRLIQQRGIRSG